MTMIKVLQLPGSISRLNGRMSVLMNIYRNLDRNRIQFDFIATDEEGESYKDEIENLGGSVFLIKDPSFKQMRSAVNKVLKNNNYDFMHYHAISPWGSVLDLGHKYNVKVITQSHATEFSEMLIKRLRNFVFSLNIFRYSDKLVAVSPEAGKKLFRNHNFEYIPTWIDKEKFTFSKVSRDRIRKKLELSDDDILVGNVSRFALQKNHQFMVETFKELVQHDKRFHIAFVGDGPLKKSIQEYAMLHHMEDNVHFIGVTKNVSDYYSAFDVFWLPSKYEGLPTVAIEAQANGLSVIASQKITKQIKVGNVIFLPIGKGSLNSWVDETEKNAKKRDSNIEVEFNQSVFKKDKVINQWEELYELR